MSSGRGTYTIQVPKRATRTLGIALLAVTLVGAGVGAGIALSGGEASVRADRARDERHRVPTTSGSDDATTTTTAPTDGAVLNGGPASPRLGGASGAAGAAAPEAAAPAPAPAPPLPAPAPDASLSITATTLPINCGTVVPTFSVRWNTLGATTMEIALGGGGFGPAPLNGSRLYRSRAPGASASAAGPRTQRAP